MTSPVFSDDTGRLTPFYPVPPPKEAPNYLDAIAHWKVGGRSPLNFLSGNDGRSPLTPTPSYDGRSPLNATPGDVVRNTATPSVDYYAGVRERHQDPRIDRFYKREFRHVAEPESIAKKLETERRYAAAQTRVQPPPRTPKSQVQVPVDIEAGTLESGREVGIAWSQGRRKEMEDRHLACTGIAMIAEVAVPYELFGVFDGHKGVSAAEFLDQHLGDHVQAALEKMPNCEDTAIWNALKAACVTCNDAIMSNVQNGAGSTAICALIINDDLWIFNVGDSRAIWSRENGTVEQLSEDAKPEVPRFTKGIQDRGGGVLWNAGCKRLNGALAMARSFGETQLVSRDGIYSVSARPKIVKVKREEISPGDFLILCCDGITDVFSSEQIGQFVHKYSKKPCDDIAQALVNSAYRAFSGDNLSAMVVPLRIENVPNPLLAPSQRCTPKNEQ